MKKIIIILISFLLIGCSDSGTKQQKVEQPKTLDVSIESNPKKVLLNETVTFTAVVKYGNVAISKDAEVQFEIIENGVSIGMVSPKHLGEGKYVLDTKFFEPGEKQVIAHVDYKALHEMPVLAFQVMNGEEEEPF
ncbi:FixH family protein [Metabacillus litoralis]|uniref:FixH family protein n=1 Tax=Metabacillus litoralis TaxID=152268 RepID=UPI00203AAD06|nr:FixH family protein [Metabacillus litoralis]MCM3655111.1 FixH family protein [Metabacillus litoralis]